MSSISIKVSQDTLKKMDYFYHDVKQKNNNVHALFIAKTEDCTITAYKSNKILFQGKNAEKEAAIWQEIKKENKKTITNNDDYYQESIGSDEVGTGDYFGPVVVVSAYLSTKNINQLKTLNIDDSKKITDKEILIIAPVLFKLLPYSLLIVHNTKYNEIMNKSNMNLNKMKALLHQQAITKLLDKIKHTPTIIIDQFCSIKNFNQYINDNQFSQKINFHTKAESQFASVACASIMARYAFLQEMEKLSKELNVPLLKGASKLVDEQGRELVKKYGKEILHKIAKMHFKNTEKIIKTK